MPETVVTGLLPLVKFISNPILGCSLLSQNKVYIITSVCLTLESEKKGFKQTLSHT